MKRGDPARGTTCTKIDGRGTHGRCLARATPAWATPAWAKQISDHWTRNRHDCVMGTAARGTRVVHIAVSRKIRPGRGGLVNRMGMRSAKVDYTLVSRVVYRSAEIALMDMTIIRARDPKVAALHCGVGSVRSLCAARQRSIAEPNADVRCKSVADVLARVPPVRTFGVGMVGMVARFLWKSAPLRSEEVLADGSVAGRIVGVLRKNAVVAFSAPIVVGNGKRSMFRAPASVG